MRAFKNSMQQKACMKKAIEITKKGCITRLTSPKLKNALPVYICVSGKAYAKLPKQVAVNMHGLQADTGLNITRIEYNWLKTSFLPIKD